MKKLLLVACAFGLSFSVWQFHNRAVASRHAPVSLSQTDVRDFVRQIFIHGVPYEQASKYDASVAPALIEMLKDRREEPYWPNIVVTLGIIGGRDTEKALIDFLRKGDDRLSDSQYRAKSSVPMALGYLINKTGSQTALAYLKDSLDPAIWNRRDIDWASPYEQSKEERNIQLSTMAILGLALSGHASARESLLSLQKPVYTEEGKRFRARVSEVTVLALRDHQIIAKEGLLNYYRKSDTPKGIRKRWGYRATAPPQSEPIDLVTGKPKPAEIVTGSYRRPPLPGPAMEKPKLPPPPSLRTPLPVPAPSLPRRPPIREGSNPQP